MAARRRATLNTFTLRELQQQQQPRLHSAIYLSLLLLLQLSPGWMCAEVRLLAAFPAVQRSKAGAKKSPVELHERMIAWGGGGGGTDG